MSSVEAGAIPQVQAGRFRRALQGTFLSLRSRNFRLFFIGQTISNTGNWLTNVALTLLVLKITGSGFKVGMLAACQYGPILFLSAWAGAVADRTDKRKMLLLTQSLEMVQSVGLAVLAFMPNPPLIGIYALAVCGGILLSFDNPVRRSFVSEMVPPSDIPNAVVLYSTIVNVSRMIGPALAGLLVTTMGYGWCFAIDAATYLAVLYSLIIMRPSELIRHARLSREKAAVKEGLRYIAATPVLWITFAMLTAIGSLAYNFNVALPLFVTRALHSTEGMFTILYSVFSAGAIASAFLIAHRSVAKMSHILLGAAALGITMLLLAIMPNIAAALPMAFLGGMASIIYMTSNTTIIQTEADPSLHGRILAIQMALMMGSTLIGGPITGWLADRFGARAPLLVGGVVCLIVAALGRYAVKHTEAKYQKAGAD